MYQASDTLLMTYLLVCNCCIYVHCAQRGIVVYNLCQKATTLFLPLLILEKTEFSVQRPLMCTQLDFQP